MVRNPGVEASAARVLHSELSPDSFPNLISLQTWLSRGGDITSTKPACNMTLSATVESLELEILAMQTLLWISDGGGGTGCCNCLLLCPYSHGGEPGCTLVWKRSVSSDDERTRKIRDSQASSLDCM